MDLDLDYAACFSNPFCNCESTTLSEGLGDGFEQSVISSRSQWLDLTGLLHIRCFNPTPFSAVSCSSKGARRPRVELSRKA